MIGKLKPLAVVAALTGMLSPCGAQAMDFQLVGEVIHATGEIQTGDAAKLAQLVRKHGLSSDFDDYTVELDSPGGLVLEGMAIGDVIRDARLLTFVSQADTSACALAYLGGTRRYATGTGVGRRMEFGATLGFHGFRASSDSVRIENETLSGSRVISALILQYANRMKSVDLDWLAQSLNVAPEKLLTVRRRADIAALSITLQGIPIGIPKNWYFNACRRIVNEEAPVIDAFETRVLPQSATIPTIRALRDAIVSGRFEEGPIANMIAALSDPDAIDLAIGGPFYLDTRKPILEAPAVQLERGAGFYFDQCLVVRSLPIRLTHTPTKSSVFTNIARFRSPCSPTSGT
jgi:hypothetical protein